MKIIGLTGGIGSGKTTISKVFIDNSIKVYNSDDRAKFLMINSKNIFMECLTRGYIYLQVHLKVIF